jgi:hypothetical protein
VLLARRGCAGLECDACAVCGHDEYVAVGDSLWSLVGGFQAGVAEDCSQDDSCLGEGEGGAEASSGSAAEGYPGVGAGAGAQEPLGAEGALVGVERAPRAGVGRHGDTRDAAGPASDALRRAGRAEAARFAPTLKVDAVTDTLARSGRTIQEVAAADVVVTTYTLFRLDADAYRKVSWAGLILDEAQYVKNHQAKTYKCVRELPAPFKLAITGTPMENNLMELWSLRRPIRQQPHRRGHPRTAHLNAPAPPVEAPWKNQLAATHASRSERVSPGPKPSVELVLGQGLHRSALRRDPPQRTRPEFFPRFQVAGGLASSTNSPTRSRRRVAPLGTS